MGCVMASALTVVGKAKQSQGNAILNTLQQFAGAIGTSLVAMIVAANQSHLNVIRRVSTAIGTQEAFGMLTFFLYYNLDKLLSKCEKIKYKKFRLEDGTVPCQVYTLNNKN